MEVESVIMLNEENGAGLRMSHLREEFAEPEKKDEVKNSVIESKWICC